MDKEVLITIQKAVDSSPELRSKKDLIENFINGINDVDNVMNEWHSYVAEEREKALVALITEEKRKEEETRAFVAVPSVTAVSRQQERTWTKYCLPCPASAVAVETARRRKKQSLRS